MQKNFNKIEAKKKQICSDFDEFLCIRTKSTIFFYLGLLRPTKPPGSWVILLPTPLTESSVPRPCTLFDSFPIANGLSGNTVIFLCGQFKDLIIIKKNPLMKIM